MKVLSEVLLQRTTASAIAAFLPEFITEYPNWAAIAEASPRRLAAALVPIGLWRRRSVSLHALAKEITRHRGRLPRDRLQIDKLPGIGQYIGNAIELFVLGARKPLLDVNMARVLERFFGPRHLADIRYDPYLQDTAHLVVTKGDPKIINWAILDFATLICRRTKPLCYQCPLKSRCSYYSTVVLVQD